MLRSGYKYSREPSTESSTEEKASVDFANNLLSAEPAGSSRRSGSMKHWSPLAALGKRARDGPQRCNTVRAGLGLGGGGGSSAESSSQNTEDLGGAERGRRNAMSNIFLGLPSSGVRRLFAVYGIDDTRGPGFRGSTGKSDSAGRSSPGEESLFAKHTRTISMRHTRPSSYSAGGVTGAMQYQQALTQQQQHQLLQQQQMLLPNYYNRQQGQFDKRRASSMRDHNHCRHESAMSSYGN